MPPPFQMSRDQFLGSFDPQNMGGAGIVGPQATHLGNIGQFLNQLNQRGGITRQPGSYTTEELMNLANVYSKRSPKSFTGQGPLMPKLQDDPKNYADARTPVDAVINALASAQGQRGKMAAQMPAQAPAQPEPQRPVKPLFPGNSPWGGGGALEQLLQYIAEKTNTR